MNVTRDRFLPVTAADMAARGWEQPDFVLVSGDAYVDHPSFANGVLSRVLEAHGYKVAVLAQPDWHDPQAMKRFGRPRYAFLVSAGNLDSLLNAYTAHKLPRSDDPYSPGGKAGQRPPRATLVYCNLIRQAYGKVPIIVGGIEASQRRFSHYDYWEDKVRRSILLDSNADMLVYGMGEVPLLALASRLSQGERLHEISDVRGTAYVKRDIAFLSESAFVERLGAFVETLPHEALLPPKGEQPQRVQERQYEVVEIAAYRRAYAEAFKKIWDEQDPVRGRPVVQRCGELRVVQMPPSPTQSAAELDRWYDLPYTRMPHPDYQAHGGVPAWLTTQHTIVTHRGCMAACSFCAITMHQGRPIQSRSEQSIVREAYAVTEMPSFSGSLSDVAGPSANMYGFHCPVQAKRGTCQHRDCLLPTPCPSLQQHLDEQVAMLNKVRAVPGVKRVFIASGVRYDLLTDPKSAGAAGQKYIENLAAHHTSGQLKVAPEHRSDNVLTKMGKPSFDKYEAFKECFMKASRKAGKEQYLVAYFVSSHPGCTVQDQIALAEYFKAQHFVPEQVQDFIPTPMTLATAMYYSGYDPETMMPVYTATTMREKRRQRALLQFDKPEFQGRVRKALKAAGRGDLIGTHARALVPPGPEEDWSDEAPRGKGPPHRARLGEARGPSRGRPFKRKPGGRR